MNFKIHTVFVGILDNYTFLLEDLKTKECCIIDPGESEIIDKYIKNNCLIAKEIWLTHHHFDHVDGVDVLKRKYKLKVKAYIGDKFIRIKKDLKIDCYLGLGEKINFHGLCFEIVPAFGHTDYQISYYCKKENILFVGDAIMSFGCGKVLEGSNEESFKTMQRLNKFPNETKIYFAHEYTLSNLRFAITVSSSAEERKVLNNLKVKIVEFRKKNIPTSPSLLENEKKHNPFLKAENLEEWSYLRAKKDIF